MQSRSFFMNVDIFRLNYIEILLILDVYAPLFKFSNKILLLTNNNFYPLTAKITFYEKE